MTTIVTSIAANDVRKLTTNGNRYWLYTISGTGTEIEVKTNQNTYLPHKAKTGCNFKQEFTELLLKNNTGASVDVVMIVGFDEYVDYS